MNPGEIKAAYDRGENISSLLRKMQNTAWNSEDIIEIAYDLQAGCYIAALGKPEIQEHKTAYGREIAKLIRSLDAVSVLEAGVGEATTLAFVLDALAGLRIQPAGFDLSWSRIAHAKAFLAKTGHPGADLFVASLFQIPYPDSSVDVVYTSHTIEPNGGKEREILAELYRVTKRYLVLLEPGYELAGPEARTRMESHGYCRNLPGQARDLGMRVLRHELFAHSANPLNPTALIVIEKDASAPTGPAAKVCPRHKTPLEVSGRGCFSPDALTAYPLLGGIPCLRPQDAIIASHYRQFLT